jgi:hypothetical protein
MKDIALLVPSCDRYSDLWEPFFLNLRKKWPGCPFRIYLVANEKSFRFPGVEVIHVGPDRGWCTNLRASLERVDAEAVFLLIDDLFFIQPVDGPFIQHLCKRFIAERMNYLRFNPSPGPTGPVDTDGIGAVASGDLYRSSTVVCLWRSSVLAQVLRDGETAWELEIQGSARTDVFDEWFASSRWLLRTRNLVIKGRYDPDVKRQLTEEGLILSDERQVMTRGQYLAFRAILLRHAAFQLVPRRWRQKIRERFRAA